MLVTNTPMARDEGESDEHYIMHLERTVAYQKQQFSEDLEAFKGRYYRYLNAQLDNLMLCSDTEMRKEVIDDMRKHLNRRD